MKRLIFALLICGWVAGCEKTVHEPGEPDHPNATLSMPLAR